MGAWREFCRIIACIDFRLISKQPFYYRNFRKQLNIEKKTRVAACTPTRLPRYLSARPASRRAPPRARGKLRRGGAETRERTGCRRGPGGKPARPAIERRGTARTRLSKKGGGSPARQAVVTKCTSIRGFPGGSLVKNLPASWETQVPSLLPEDPRGPGATKPVATSTEGHAS